MLSIILPTKPLGSFFLYLARHKMNRIISYTAEYGCYVFDHACKPPLTDFMKNIDVNVIGKPYGEEKDKSVDNVQLITINEIIRFHNIEIIGAKLRKSMTVMKTIV